MIPVDEDNATEIATKVRNGELPVRPCGWVTLWTPAGVQVTLPVTTGPTDYKAMLANVDAAVGAGFLAMPPGVVGAAEQEEMKESIGWVCRRVKENKDRTETPVIDLYVDAPHLTFHVLSIYLNNADQQSDFERASGMLLASIPVFVGTASPRRGASRQSDEFIRRVDFPFTVVMRPHPKYSEEAAKKADEAKQTYTIPKREFVRWELPSRPAAIAAGKPAVSSPPPPPPPPDQQKPPNVYLREQYASEIKAVESRPQYLAICSRVAADVKAGKLSDDDRKWLAPYARDASAKYPETQLAGK
jgi:hypothetical protein